MNGNQTCAEAGLQHSMFSVDQNLVLYSIALTISFGLTTFIWRSWTPRQHVDLPFIKIETDGFEEQKQRFLSEAGRILSAGYDRFTNGLFQVATSEGPTVIVSRSFIDELKAYPEDTVSFDRRAEKTMMNQYTGCSGETELMVHVIKSDFTAHLNPLTTVVDEETKYALRELGIKSHEWTPVCIFEKMLRIVAMTSGCTFCQELTRNEEWITISIGYTINVFNGANAIKRWPAFVRPVVYGFVPEIRKVWKMKRRAVQLVQNVLEDRRRAEAEQGLSYEKPKDALQWLVDKIPTWQGRGKHDINHITDLLLMTGFASIHSNTGTLTNILYDMVARPHYIDLLREEVEKVMAGHNGELSRFALDQMWKLDSFMKESMRLTPTNLTMFKREVLKPITLSDGTFLPAGTFVEIPAGALARDRNVVPGDADPAEFDGLRFEKLRYDALNKEAAKYLFATVGIDGGMHFGFGRRACPGRFFTTNLMKLVLSYILMDYDFKMPEDNDDGTYLTRYENLHSEATNFVNPTKCLLMRKRNK